MVSYVITGNDAKNVKSGVEALLKSHEKDPIILRT